MTIIKRLIEIGVINGTLKSEDVEILKELFDASRIDVKSSKISQTFTTCNFRDPWCKFFDFILYRFSRENEQS